MTIQDTYTDSIRQSQETWASVMSSFTDNVTKTFGQAGTPFAAVDPNTAVDQVFDFWAKALETQRELAKQFVGISVDATEKIRAQVEAVSETVKHEV